MPSIPAPYPVATKPLALTRLDITHTQTLVFAGGGNRCMWQAGLVSHLLEAGWQLPVQLVGTSAGAGVACALMAGKVAEGMQACKTLYANNPRIVDASNLWRGRLAFAHEHIFPAWVASYLNDSNFEALRTARSRLRGLPHSWVCMCQHLPARWLTWWTNTSTTAFTHACRAGWA